MKVNMRRRVLALAVSIAAIAPGLAGPETQVLAQDLQRLRVPGKVSAVVWTRRNDGCTLQVVLQMTTEYQVRAKVHAQRAAAGVAVAPLATPDLPRIQAWLLRRDGTLVARTPGSPSFPAVMKASDGVPLELKYSFPASAASEAAAVAIMIDDNYYIEQLRPFETRQD